MKFNISDSTRAAIEIRLQEWEAQPIEAVPGLIKSMLHSFRLILALTQKYSSLVMNPPYMGANNMNAVLSNYIKTNYSDGKSDLMTVFLMISDIKTLCNGKYSLIILPSWLFLSTFKNIRKCIIDNNHIDSLLHMGRGIFGIDWGSVTFTITKSRFNSKGSFFRLHKRNFQHIYYYHIEQLFLKTLQDHSFKYNFDEYRDDNGTDNSFISSEQGIKLYYESYQSNFSIIPGFQIGYWLSQHSFELFAGDKISKIADCRSGMSTTDNERFLRLWHEVDNKKIGYGYKSIEETKTGIHKWFPYNKGGGYRKWSGSRDVVVNYYKDGEELKYWVVNNPNDPKTTSWSRRLFNTEYSFKRCLTWSAISASNISVRYTEGGFMFDSGGASAFMEDKFIYYMLGLMNSIVSNEFLKLLNPTINFGPGTVGSIPLVYSDNLAITNCTKANVVISLADWNAHEISWDFQRNELMTLALETFNSPLECVFYESNGNHGSYFSDAKCSMLIKDLYEEYISKWRDYFINLHDNEEELNRQFIEIYGLQEELTPEVPLDEITILQQGELTIENNQLKWHADEVIRQLISYAIGCWMGRYRLDKPGLYIAHPDAKPEEIATYEYNGQSFEIDDDGIIPLLPAYASFPDIGYKRVQDFVRIAFGAETLTENINFIEEALGTSLEKFMVKDFWKYHKKMYQNRPIYWLFSSKKGAFQCLTYMHRMNAYTVEQIRSKYLLPHIDWLKNHIAEMESRASQLTTQERKLKDQMTKDLAECIEYHDDLHIVADQNISFDLDNGVVENYKLFGNVLAKLK